MKNLKLNIKSNHLIFLALLLLLILNYNYYEKLYKHYQKTNFILKIKLIETTNKIYENINKFNENISVFKKIKELKDKTIEKEYEIEYLKKKIKTKKDILSIFKTLVLKSNIKLEKIEVLSEEKEKNVGKVILGFSGMAKLENFIELLDMIEGKREFLVVESYKLKEMKDAPELIKIKMKLKFLYLNQ